MASVGDKLSKRGMRGDDILRLFKEAEQDLIAVVANADVTSSYGRYRSEQAKAINEIIVRLQKGTLIWAEMEIGALFEAGQSETQADIDAFGEKEFQLKFSGVNTNAVRILTDEAYMEFGGTIMAMKQDAERGLFNRRKMADEIVKGVIQGRSVARTQKELIKILKGDGITILKTRNGLGRRNKVEPYTNMLVRTQSMTAYNLGARAQLLGSGRRFAIFPTIVPDIDGEDICNEWERKKYVDLKKDPLPPQSTHPSCRHRVRAASFEQLKRERPDLYKIAVSEFRKAAEA